MLSTLTQGTYKLYDSENKLLYSKRFDICINLRKCKTPIKEQSHNICMCTRAVNNYVLKERHK